MVVPIQNSSVISSQASVGIKKKGSQEGDLLSLAWQVRPPPLSSQPTPQEWSVYLHWFSLRLFGGKRFIKKLIRGNFNTPWSFQFISNCSFE